MPKEPEPALRSSHVCPWWLCFTFDNPLRRLIHDPKAIVGPFVRPGDHVLDLGAGMGYFSLALSRLVGPTGRVTAIDIQPEMLEALVRRAERHEVAERITAHQATPSSIGGIAAADFALAFWMVHEVPDRRRFLIEVFERLKPGARLLVVEPRLHVSKASFVQTVETATNVGFELREAPRIRFSASALLERPREPGSVPSTTPGR